ncbi:hypothetical protein [Paenibacillus oceani]|uniref:Uncharacterized protein n=1 Tax=Paenibacillus oceani TaxID=2772510 RepID=A0A927C5B3_9BACL|nr:hypothetical protein [Paenibacillus oceani]MBD2861629.1 hypothetical protein [Paenibacillus oceani]
MPVQITINGADAAESLRELSALAVGLTGSTAALATAPAPVKPVETEAPKQTRRTKKEEPAVEKNDPVDEDPAAKPDDSREDDEGDHRGEPIPTDVELRAKAQEVGKKAGKEEVKALLDKYESSNITGIPDDKRVAFMRDLEALL